MNESWALQGDNTFSKMSFEYRFPWAGRFHGFVPTVNLGQMMVGATSSYIRPGFHASGDTLFDWNIEFGFKVIWW